MKRWILRLMVGVAFAAPLMLLTVAVATAQPSGTPPARGDLTWRACHQDTHGAWADGSHGKASESEAFLADWGERGKPRECLVCHTTGYDPVADTYLAEGVACEACHSPVPADHPTEPMPSDRSRKLCGTCPPETLFELQSTNRRPGT